MSRTSRGARSDDAPNQPSTRSGGALTALASALLLSTGFGCAQSVGDIDRTQPDLLSKEHFQGQWFVRETMVHVPETSASSFVGEPGTLETIVWDIQQDWLVGYRAYEVIPGLDSEAESSIAAPSFQPVTPGLGDGRDPELYKGEPIVAYRITSHVDVQRGYNPRTGEQNNVISENTSDRPWYERDHIRVDWSSTGADHLMMVSPMFGSGSTMSSFVPENEGGTNAPHVETDDAGLATYMDFTVRRTITPTFFGCIRMLQRLVGDCAGQEHLVRTSFLKVDPEREQDYVPLVYDDQRQGEFGFFRVERTSYDRDLGTTFSGLIQLADRHELWRNSRDSSGNPLPYSARSLRSVVYALSENYPEEMLPVTEEIAADYDAAFKQVAAAARGQSLAELQEDVLADTGGECLFCLDLNEDNHARNGDIRYNFIYWVHDPQVLGPLGFGPSSPNPETGRIVSASAYVYGASVDVYAESAKQLVELMIPEEEGGLTEDELMDRSYFVNAARGQLNPIDPRAIDGIRGLQGDELARKVLGDESFERMQEFTAAGVDALSPAIPGYEQDRLARLVDTPLEALMVPPEWAAAEQRGEMTYLKARAAAATAHAQATGAPLPDHGRLGHLSVRNWWAGGGALDEYDTIQQMAERKNLWLADAQFNDPAIAGLAREVQGLGLQGDDLRQFLRERLYRAVMLHEIGHTIGLRHNFSGSADPLNYHEEYWDERIKSIEPVADFMRAETPSAEVFLYSNCAIEGSLISTNGTDIPGTDTSEACAEQRAGRMAEYQYSSIMDYGGRFNADFHGLGRYDLAAMASGYGDLVEVFDEQAMQGMAEGGNTYGVNVREAALGANQVRNPVLYQGLDNALMFQGLNGAMRNHYTNYPDLFGGVENLGRRTWIPRQDYFDSLEAANRMPAAERNLVPVKVPYLSCYDEFVDSVDNCHRWDQGADHYEIVANNLQAYKEYYVFNNFQRDRIGFNSFNVYRRVRSRYFLPLTNMYQHWFWGVAVTGLAPLGTPRGDLGLFATREGLNQLLNTLSTPDYGPHWFDDNTGMYEPANTQCPDDIESVLIPRPDDSDQFVSMPGCLTVPRGVGRSFFSSYDSSGYDIFRRILEAGHFYDSMAAMDALGVTSANVVGIGSDVGADQRAFFLPYNLAFPDDLSNIFSSIYKEDDPSYALHVAAPGSAPGEVVSRGLFNDIPAAEVQALPIIRPGRTYTTRIQALVSGMTMQDGNLNSTFARQGQISLGGSGEQRSAPEGFDLVEVADPLTGRVFVAYRRSDGAGGPWYAADMLEEAQRIVDDPSSSENQIENIFSDIELVRTAFGIFGN